MKKEDLFIAFESFAELSSSLPTCTTSSASFLRVGTWKVISVDDDKYLVASVQSNTLRNSSPSSLSHVNINDLEEDDLHFDCAGGQNLNSDGQGTCNFNLTHGELSSNPHPSLQSPLHGEFHIVYHPMYQIPC